MQPADFLSLVVEVSITIAGFSGIVIVLGRRASGEWSPKDQIQLRALLLSSITPISIAGLGLVLLTTTIPEDYIWRICSGTGVGLFSFYATTGIRRARKLLKTKLDPVVSRVLLPIAILTTLLGLANAVVIAAFWPLAILLVWLIGVSIFNFIQLLWRAILEDST